ncbi:hypothetical protein KSF_074670 [Reticulibacter mediterranei]|uniref:Uncharacterized protein n=1 Tax=Reticulibacter mediterranei TaxID=2778369 RepID=A0A8J3N3S1_9CHLR|nr:hypothetical protein [Reticulibacter mediterranei]GHO97419.1 hypothetical protein KSF_074670 [Reticulibacter mediterranei]
MLAWLWLVESQLCSLARATRAAEWLLTSANQDRHDHEKTAGRAEKRENLANLLRWCFEEEHVSHLTRPEIAHYVVEVTKELADLLGISIDEGTGKSEN